MSKPGRNDPCPCGSGKKYKRCCLPRDEGRQSDLRALEHLFEEEGYEEQIAAFQRALEKDLLDADLAFDLLGQIESVASSEGAHHRIIEVLEDVRRRAPHLYEANRQWYEKWLIESDIVLGRAGDLPGHLAFYASGEGDIDLFFHIIDLLMYHGHAEPLIGAMKQAWSRVSRSTKIIPWGIDEFVETLTGLVIYDYLERVQEPQADDPALIHALTPFYTADRAWLREVMDHLLGRSAATWTPQDFVHRRRRVAGDEDEVEKRLYFLSLHLVRTLRQGLRIPWSRAEIARRELVAYLGSDRHVEAAKGRAPLLHPRHASLDPFLAGYFDFLSPQPYKAAALLEAMPAYLDFLCQRGLMEPARRTSTIRSLRPLVLDALEPIEFYAAHPATIGAVLDRWGLSHLHERREEALR